MTTAIVRELDEDYRDTPDGKHLTWAHDMYEYELQQQSEGRRLRARDERFYDGHQHTDEEKAVYASRSQTARTYNEIKPAVDWIIGSERRTRSDWNILPRSQDDVESALLKTKLVKYIDDINKAKWQRSKAFEDCVKTGEGWTRITVEPNEDGELMIHLNYENWQNMLIDGQSVQEDLSDCRYLWCSKIVDLDTLIEYFPSHKSALKLDAGEWQDLDDDMKADQIGSDGQDVYNTTGSYMYCRNNSDAAVSVVRSGTMSITGGYYSSTRQAVRVWEMWYRKTKRVTLLASAGGLTGQIFDSNNQAHQAALKAGAKKRETVREQMHMSIYTATTVLFHGPSIYKHNRFPFVRRLASVDKTTKSPYGLIRQIVDPQSDLNARRNQALWLMATRQVIADDDAVEDINETIEQVSKVNGYIKKKKNSYFEIRDNVALAAPQVQMGEMDSGYIKQISGVTSENRGQNSNALSGVAIQSLQEQGTIITTPIIDNHQLAHQIEGEIILSLCEQYISHKMQFRITNDTKEPTEKDFATLNDGKPETDITATQADFVVSHRDYRETMKLALAEQLLNIGAQATQATGTPEAGIPFVEMAVELQDIPNKDRLLSKLRELSGLPPMDENAEAREKREAQQQAEAQQQQAMQEQAVLLDFEEKKAKIDYHKSRANQYNREGEREKANARKLQMEAIKASLEAAGLVMDNAQLAQVADDLLGSVDGVLNGTQPAQANAGELAEQGMPVEQAPLPMIGRPEPQPTQPPQQAPMQEQQPDMPAEPAQQMSEEEAAMMEQALAQQSNPEDDIR